MGGVGVLSKSTGRLAMFTSHQSPGPKTFDHGAKIDGQTQVACSPGQNQGNGVGGGQCEQQGQVRCKCKRYVTKVMPLCHHSILKVPIIFLSSSSARQGCLSHCYGTTAARSCSSCCIFWLGSVHDHVVPDGHLPHTALRETAIPNMLKLISILSNEKPLE